MRTRFELSEPLKALGMPLAFDPDRADLSGIAGQPADLHLQAVVHETYIRVDEAGTEAAAATAVVAGVVSGKPPPEVVFNVDRPFVFVVRDTKTGAILFLGTVSRPQPPALCRASAQHSASVAQPLPVQALVAVRGRRDALLVPRRGLTAPHRAIRAG